MSQSIAFCPQCKREAVFLEAARSRKCAVCGFEFEIANAPPVIRQRSDIGVLGIIVRFMLILAAVFAVIIGVLFVGCAIALKGL